MADASTKTKRGPGRPASFPNTETKALMTKLPQDAIGMIHELAEIRGENKNLTLDRMIRRAFKDATRKRSK
jgi:hypothetical protein